MMSGIQWYQFQDNLRHILRSEAGKRILVDFTKMKRGKASEYSVILTAFYLKKKGNPSSFAGDMGRETNHMPSKRFASCSGTPT